MFRILFDRDPLYGKCAESRGKMNLVVVAIMAIAVGALAAWTAALWTQRRADSKSSEIRQEVQNLLASQSQGFAAQLGQVSQTVAQQLGNMSQQIQSGMASTGSLVSDAQRAVSEQLQSATTIMGTLQQQLGKVQQSGQDLSEAAKAIEGVLGGSKTRGLLGEVALERMLVDTLPASAYEMQYRFSNGEVVDAALHFGGKVVPIDSKFPLDDFRRLMEDGEESRKGFCNAVRLYADSIAKKYIVPGENTLDFALMFVPSETVYYELLMSTDTKGVPLDAYCRERRVIPVSPNSLYAHLSVILMGLKGLQIEENAVRLHASLAGLKTQWDNFASVFEKLGTHLRNASQSYSDADRKLDRARDALDQMAQGALPDAEPKALEAQRN
jgi:DNA recombination protein RmuC